MADYVGALDQGTTSTRFMIFDHAGQAFIRRAEVRDRHPAEQHEVQPGVGHRRVERVIDRGQRRGSPVGQDVAGHVERVARGPERGQVRFDRGDRLRRERRDRDVFPAGPVGDEAAGTAGGGQHAHPAPPRPAVVAEQPGGAQQFLEAGHPDHAELAEHRVDHRVVAGDRAGVGECGHLAGRARAGLQHHDRLAGLCRLCRGLGEAVGLADFLQEQADDPGLLVLDQVAEHVRGADHRLVAQGDQGAHADGPGPGEGQHRGGQRAALQRDADRPGSQRQRDAERERPGGRVGIEEAEAIRAEEQDPVPGGLLDQPVLAGVAFRAELTVAGGEHHGVADPRRGRVVDDVRHRVRRHHDEGQVHGLGQVPEAGHGRAAEHRRMPGVHRDQRPIEADGGAGGQDELRPARGVRRAHHGEAARGEELPQALRGHGHLLAHGSLGSLGCGSLGRPRARSPIMVRWISLVPE